jgi:hypothetical protein
MEDVRINDKRFSNETTFDPTEFDRAPAGTPLDGATTLAGVPMPYSQALTADPASVLVTYNNVPMRLSQALSLGLCTKEQLGAQAQPAATTSPNQSRQQADEGDTDDEAAAEEIARAPVFSQSESNAVSAIHDALSHGGFDANAVALDVISTGEIDADALEAIARGAGISEDEAVDLIVGLNQQVTDRLVQVLDAKGWAPESLLPAVYEWDKAGYARAGLATLSSGSLTSLVGRIAAFIEQHPDAAQQYAKR